MTDGGGPGPEWGVQAVIPDLLTGPGAGEAPARGAASGQHFLQARLPWSCVTSCNARPQVRGPLARSHVSCRFSSARLSSVA